jgi:hypothetical protein
MMNVRQLRNRCMVCALFVLSLFRLSVLKTWAGSQPAENKPPCVYLRIGPPKAGLESGSEAQSKALMYKTTLTSSAPYIIDCSCSCSCSCGCDCSCSCSCSCC